MRLWELLLLALGGVRRTPFRVTLTSLGVAIASGALVTMVGFALGVQEQVEEPFRKSEMLNRIDVYTRAPARHPHAEGPSSNEDATVLDDATMARISGLRGVVLAYPELRLANVEIIREDNPLSAAAVGLPREAGRLQFVRDALVAGRFFGQNGGDEAIVGVRLLKSLGYDSPAEALGQTLKLRVKGLARGTGQTFQFEQRDLTVPIVGVWDSPSSRHRFAPDTIFLPQDVIRDLPGAQFESTLDWLRRGMKTTKAGHDHIVVRVAGPSDLFEVEKRIQEMGLQTRTALGQIQEIRRAFLIMDLVLTAIGTVALIVAALGIINTLLMAVLERYREIGVYKALGASNGDVRIIFLGEAGLVGLFGGLGGLLLGRVVSWIIDAVVNAIARGRGIDEPIVAFSFPAYLLAGAVLFAIAVSLLSGVLPASRAARVDPIRALRSE